MIIKEDKTYLSKLDLELINRGYASLDIHSVHFEKYFSDEQENKNAEMSKKMNNEEWENYCDNEWFNFSKKLIAIIEKLDDEFLIYQYKKELNFSSDKWDYYFYSNRGSNNKKYFTFFQLSPNGERTLEKRLIDIDNLISSLKSQQIDDEVLIRIQYTACINENKVKSDAVNYIKKIKNTFINYQGMIGKIKVVNNNENGIKYGFFKKRAKNHYYNISYSNILSLTW